MQDYYTIGGLILIVLSGFVLAYLAQILKRARTIKLINKVGIDKFLHVGALQLLVVIRMQNRKVSPNDARDLWRSACAKHGWKVIPPNTIEHSFRDIVFPLLEMSNVLSREVDK